MKKIFVLLALLSFSALSARDLPQSISAKCGNVELRFDARKFWNINSVIYKGERVGTDLGGAHYGMVYTAPRMKGFIGSGHTETGVAEKVEKITFSVDGKEVVPTAKLPEGRTLKMEKLSIVGGFEVLYTITVKDDVIYETTAIKALKSTTVSVLYTFMHPWATTFTRFLAYGGKDPVIDKVMVSNNSFPMGKYYPYIALFNPKTGTALATKMNFVSAENPGYHTKRLLWDRTVYRKDYFVPFCNTTLVEGFKAEVAAETRFFKTTSDNFIKDAENIFPPDYTKILPQSISARCGNVDLRFDARKFWNINSIIYKGERMTTDFTGSHYGMTYTVPGLKGFIGSGHTETGVSEVVKSLRFVIDGKETVPAEKLPEGKTLHMEKHSIIGNFDVIYTLIVKDDVIKEITRIKVLKTTTLSVIYCFMHPWVTDFDRFYAFGGKEPEIRQNMDSKDRWYMGHKNYPVIALFNSKTGSAVASEVWFNTPNDPSFHTGRILRDCSVYRKDYFVPFCNTTLVEGFKAEVAAETRFFKTTSDNFIKDAEKVFPPVK